LIKIPAESVGAKTRLGFGEAKAYFDNIE